MSQHVLHVCDHRRVWQEKPGDERTDKQKEGIEQLVKNLPSLVSPVGSVHKVGKPPGGNRIKMYEFMHTNGSTVFPYTMNTSLCYNRAVR